MASDDYYKILGVRKNAKISEIKSAFRKLAHKHHPDVNKDKAAADNFRKIKRAHDVLSDPNERKKYDQFEADTEKGGGIPKPDSSGHNPGTTGDPSDKDAAFEITLRPPTFSDFTGQSKVKERVELFVQAAKKRKEALGHMLLSGPPGLGKTTLAFIVAKEMGVNIRCTSGPVIEKPGDLAGLLTNLEKGDVLFIDEIHRLQTTVEEYLYPAMEDYRLDIIIDQGPNARSVRINLPRFTLIGATTRSGLLTEPMRTRFEINARLDYYLADDLKQIVLRSARILNVDIDDAGAGEIARRARGTPRIANNLLRRVRDYAQVKADGHITREIADKALTMLDIDQRGLDEMDKRILETLIHKFNGGPVGLGSLAVAVGEEPDTIEEVYEPYLIMQGYLNRTPQGRVATANAYEVLGLKAAKGKQGQLL